MSESKHSCGECRSIEDSGTGSDPGYTCLHPHGRGGWPGDPACQYFQAMGGEFTNNQDKKKNKSLGKTFLDLSEHEGPLIGGVKHDAGKLRYDLLPAHALVSVARAFTLGAEKYGERNWEKGMKWSRLYASLMRHLQEWWLGGDNDPDDALPFMAKVAGAALMLQEYAKTHPELDDRPKGAA